MKEGRRRGRTGWMWERARDGSVRVVVSRSSGPLANRHKHSPFSTSKVQARAIEEAVAGSRTRLTSTPREIRVQQVGRDGEPRDGLPYELEWCELAAIVATCRSRDEREQRPTESVQATRPSSVSARIARPGRILCFSWKGLAGGIGRFLTWRRVCPRARARCSPSRRAVFAIRRVIG